MNEINGFKIDKYNQYNFPENASTHTCPICSHNRKKKNEKCIKIFWDTGLFECYHCGYLGQLHTFKKSEIKPKEYKKPIWSNKTELSTKLVKWFKDRKISQNTLKLMRISGGMEWMPQHKKEVNTCQFNYFLYDELVNIKFRDAKKNFKLVKDAEKIFYNLDSIRTAKECIICEGEIDACTFVESGYYNTVSIPNGFNEKGNINLSYLDEYYDYFKNKEKIYLSFDNDTAGQNGLSEFIRRLTPEKCYVIDLEGEKDANDYVKKYGYERLRTCKETAKIVPITNVSTLNNFKVDLHDFYLNGIKRGYITGIKPFDDIFSVYLKSFIAVTGIPTHGKSDFVDHMICGYSIENEWKGAICSPENKPEFLHIDKLCRKIYGKRPETKSEIESEEYQIVENFVDDNFYFVDFEDGTDLKKVLDKIRELVYRKGIKYFVLDPYNKIKLKESASKDVVSYTNDYLNEIDIFCKKYDLLGIIVAHPVKPEKINGKRQKPDFYSIKGGGEWFDMSNYGLCVWRDFEKELVEISIMKCKFQNLGQNGAKVWFKWNPLNGRYTEVNGNPNDDFDSISWNFDNNSWLQKINNIEIENEIESNINFYDENYVVDEIPF